MRLQLVHLAQALLARTFIAMVSASSGAGLAPPGYQAHELRIGVENSLVNMFRDEP
jgi:hypothetical protein